MHALDRLVCKIDQLAILFFRIFLRKFLVRDGNERIGGFFCFEVRSKLRINIRRRFVGDHFAR